LVDVAIELQLEADEAIKYQKELWKLEQLDRLSQLYDELGENIWPFVELFKLSKEAGMDAQQVLNFLRMANGDIPRVQKVRESLRFELAKLESDKSDGERQILDYHHVLSEYRAACQFETDRINQLRQKRSQLERVVHQANQSLLEIKNTVQRVVEGVLEEHRRLLEFALLALIESLRKDPRKLQILYWNLTTGRSAEQNEFTSVNARLDDEYIEDTPEERILLDGAMAIYERMVEELTNKAIVNLPSRLHTPSISAYIQNEENKEGSLPSPNYNQDRFNQSEIDNRNSNLDS
jgi:chromosome segregation ATPase